MDKQQFINGMLELEQAYKHKAYKEFNITTDKASLNYWYNYFTNMNYATFIKGVRKYILEEKELPTISGLFEKMAQGVIDNEYNYPEEEWQKATRLILNKGLSTTEIQKELQNNKPTLVAIEKIGISRIKKSQESDLKYLESEFLKVYSQEVKKEAREKAKNSAIGIGTDPHNLSIEK